MNTLALTTKVQNGVKPPAAKREIIQAMAELKHAQLLAERAELVAAKEAQEVAAKAELLQYAMDNIAKLELRPDLGYCSGREICSVDVRADLIFANLPRGLQKSLEKYHKLHEQARILVPDLKKIKKEITAKMQGFDNPSQRIQALIETPETKRALEKMLKSLDAKPETTIDV